MSLICEIYRCHNNMVIFFDKQRRRRYSELFGFLMAFKYIIIYICGKGGGDKQLLKKHLPGENLGRNCN